MVKRSYIALAVAIGLAACSCETAVAADSAASPAPLKSLRHLTFGFTFDSQSKVASHSSGLERSDLSASGSGTKPTNMSGGTSGGAFGSGTFGTETSGLTSSAGPSTSATGTISIDVMAATGDGGLVVDVSENSAKRAPVVRVGINDRSLYYPPGADVTDEERIILHYLARDLVKADTLAAGTTWGDDMAQAAGSTNRMRYTVTSVDEGAKTLDLRLAGTSNTTGANGYASFSNGSLVYDLGTLVPLRLSLVTHSTLDKSGDEVTIESQLTSTLQSDTFKKSS